MNLASKITVTIYKKYVKMRGPVFLMGLHENTFCFIHNLKSFLTRIFSDGLIDPSLLIFFPVLQHNVHCR